MSARRLARNVTLVCAIRLLFWTHFVSAVLVPFFRDWGGIGLDRILLLNAWFMLWAFALEVPTGAIADRFGRKVSATLGYAIGAAAIGVYVSAPRLEVFLAAEVLMALGFALVSGAEDALLYDSLVFLGRKPSIASVAKAAARPATKTARASAAASASSTGTSPRRVALKAFGRLRGENAAWRRLDITGSFAGRRRLLATTMPR